MYFNLIKKIDKNWVRNNLLCGCKCIGWLCNGVVDEMLSLGCGDCLIGLLVRKDKLNLF